MANRLYNKQVTPKGYKMGGRVKKMGGGMMKRKPMMKGSKPDFLDLDKDNNKTESMKSAAASAKKMMKGGRVKKMGGGISKLNPGLQAFMKKKMDRLKQLREELK